MSSPTRVAWQLALAMVVPVSCARPPARVSAPTAATIPQSDAGQSSAPPKISRVLLAQRDVPQLPGWESRLYLVEYAPGAAAPLHHHPVEGIGYVIRGSFESAFAGEPIATVREGESFVDRPIVPHVLFRNADAHGPLRFLLSYVVRKGDPVVETP